MSNREDRDYHRIRKDIVDNRDGILKMLEAIRKRKQAEKQAIESNQ